MRQSALRDKVAIVAPIPLPLMTTIVIRLG